VLEVGWRCECSCMCASPKTGSRRWPRGVSLKALGVGAHACTAQGVRTGSQACASLPAPTLCECLWVLRSSEGKGWRPPACRAQLQLRSVTQVLPQPRDSMSEGVRLWGCLAALPTPTPPPPHTHLHSITTEPAPALAAAGRGCDAVPGGGGVLGREQRVSVPVHREAGHGQDAPGERCMGADTHTHTHTHTHMHMHAHAPHQLGGVLLWLGGGGWCSRWEEGSAAMVRGGASAGGRVWGAAVCGGGAAVGAGSCGGGHISQHQRGCQAINRSIG